MPCMVRQAVQNLVLVLLCCFCGLNGYVRAVFLLFAEDYRAVNEGEKGVVLSHSHVLSGVMYGSSLTYYYIACFGELTAEDFYSKSFAF